MTESAKEIISTNIEDEMRQSYMDYAMSVIVGRALPDVRDGLKPVHRRVLYAMHGLGNDWNKPYKKSARVVGDVIGKYHPHGDSAVYDAIVRMAQPFSLRYMLVDGQGNFGSVDGDSPAAMRYTEVRMARIAHEMLADLEKETVDYAPNYDESEQEPVVLPARIPNLLINGSAGIAVGLATNIPPHNLVEVINACVAFIDDPAITVEGLMEHIPGPDFPTGGIIYGTAGIHEAYRTGRGRVQLRARTEIETDDNGRQRIVVTELPYQVNKAMLLEKIAQLVREKRIEGISELRDESDKDGMRMVIELRRGEIPEVVLNNLYLHTQLQNVFGINIVALVDGQPRLLGLRETIEAFIRHRREVVTRRTIFDLRKARERAHILEGLAVALANIDEIIALIKAAPGPAEARAALVARVWKPGSVSALLAAAGAEMSRPDGLDRTLGLGPEGYRLSETQAQAILDLRLHRLTGLEQEKIHGEYSDILQRIAELALILSSPARLMAVIREELIAIREQFGDARRTEIRQDEADLTREDLITPEDVVVTLSHGGYVKSQPLEMYQAQRRGGRGKSAAAVKDEDFIDKLFIANTHDTVLCFSSRGKVYWKKVYELPQASRNARGRPIVNLLPLEEDERITTMLPIREYEEDKFIFMATLQGTVKKTPLVEFSRPRSSGIIAVALAEDDRLIGAQITDGSSELVLVSSEGKAVRFHESTVRPMGRTAAGVRGIRLGEGQHAIALLVADDQGYVLTATENGYGKRTRVGEYPLHNRGGQGVIAIQASERNGQVVGAELVYDGDDVMLISAGGTVVRIRVDEVPVLGRNTQGVRLIRLAEGERLVGIDRLESFGDEGEGGEDATAGDDEDA
jgi:DNA gyrase subunit A